MSEEMKTEVLETPETTEEMNEIQVEVEVPEDVEAPAQEGEIPVEAVEEVEAPAEETEVTLSAEEVGAPAEQSENTLEVEAVVEAPVEEAEAAEETPVEEAEAAEETSVEEAETPDTPVEEAEMLETLVEKVEEAEIPAPVAEQVETPAEVMEDAVDTPVEKASAPIETMADYEENFDDANPWNLVTAYMRKKTVLPVKVEGVVNGGAIAMVEGLRGFIPASKLSLSYIENLETFLLQDIEVQVIDVDQANNRLVLSARDILRKKERAAREEEIRNIKIGSVMSGKVETLQNYGAFVKLENGLSGLVHVSQISQKRIKTPGEVLKVGDKVEVKIIGVKDGKISLSMKALQDPIEEVVERVVLPKSEEIGTNLGDLFKNIKL